MAPACNKRAHDNVVARWSGKRVRGEEAQWADWMRAANAGDNGAYRRLLEALAPFLRRLVRQGFAKTGQSAGDVEDVVQETLLAIHLKRQTWDADQLFTPWVRAIARTSSSTICAGAETAQSCPSRTSSRFCPPSRHGGAFGAGGGPAAIHSRRPSAGDRAGHLRGGHQHPRGFGQVRNFRGCHPRGLAPGLERLGGSL